MSEMLSQQEVDALLQAVTSDLGPQAEGVETAARAAAAAVASTFGSLLDGPVEAGYRDAEPADAAALAARLGGPAVWVESAAGGAVAGSFGVLIPAADALALAGILLGPDGSPDALDDAALEALGEAWSQAMSQIGRAWGEAAGATVSIAPPRTLATDPGVDPPPALSAAGLWRADVALRLGDAQASLTLVFSPELAEAWRQALGPAPGEAGGPPDAGHEPPGGAAGGPAPAGRAARGPGVGPDAGQGGGQGGGVMVQGVQFGDLRAGSVGEAPNLDLILDVPLHLTVELGRTRRPIREILALGTGSVLELDKLAGEAVDILVNGRLIAKGEVVVINENFGVRITEIGTPAERVEKLR